MRDVPIFIPFCIRLFDYTHVVLKCWCVSVSTNTVSQVWVMWASLSSVLTLFYVLEMGRKRYELGKRIRTSPFDGHRDMVSSELF